MPPVTFLTPGAGSSSLAGALPLGYNVAVQSVVATVANGAGGASVIELTIADPSGEVIADKAQSSPIPAAGAGRATWALRLADDSAAAAAAAALPTALAFSNSHIAVPDGVDTPLDSCDFSLPGAAGVFVANGTQNLRIVLEGTYWALLQVFGLDGNPAGFSAGFSLSALGNVSDFWVPASYRGAAADQPRNLLFETVFGLQAGGLPRDVIPHMLQTSGALQHVSVWNLWLTRLTPIPVDHGL